MDKTRKSLLKLFQIGFLFFLLVLAQEIQTILNCKAEIINQEKIIFSRSNPPQEEIFQETQRSFDRSINIFNVVVTLIVVLVGLITIIPRLAIAFDLSEFQRWLKIRKEAEKHRKAIKKLEEEVKPIVDRIKKTENYLS
jgi:hypothetical protein